MDVLLLPTAGTIYTKEAVEADPIRAELQPRLLHELRQPDGPGRHRRARRLPGRWAAVRRVASSDRRFPIAPLLALGERFLHENRDGTGRGAGLHLGGGRRRAPDAASRSTINLTERGARLVEVVPHVAGLSVLCAGRHRAAEARAGARGRTTQGPASRWKSGPCRRIASGGLWPRVPPPLAIGSVQLDTGEWVKGFVCEPLATRRRHRNHAVRRMEAVHEERRSPIIRIDVPISNRATASSTPTLLEVPLTRC